MLKKVLKKLEDPSRPLLEPNIKKLKFWGLLLPDNLLKKYLYLLNHFAVVVIFFLQIIEVWTKKSDVILFVDSIKYILFTFITMLKLLSFIFWKNHWLSIIDYITVANVEQRKTTNASNMAIIEKLTRYCRTITYIFGLWPFLGTIFKVIVMTLKFISSSSYRSDVKNGTDTYKHLFNFWIPFPINVPVRYILCLAFEFYIVIHICGWFSSFDTIIITIMVFFKGELELLRLDSSQIFGTVKDPVTDEEALRRINSCHNRHVLLMRYKSLFNKCLSPVMFSYVLVCALNICLIAYQINIETSNEQVIVSISFLVNSVLQLFMFCWHANEVYFASTNLMHGPYESLWWSRNVKLRRCILLLSAQFQTLIIFSAGPFTDLNLPTFVTILKAAYSYYTLLSQSQD